MSLLKTLSKAYPFHTTFDVKIIHKAKWQGRCYNFASSEISFLVLPEPVPHHLVICLAALDPYDMVRAISNSLPSLPARMIRVLP